MPQDTTTPPNEQMAYRKAAQLAGDERLSATEAAMQCFKEYAKERPEVVALWAFGLGFVLGWKLKIW